SSEKADRLSKHKGRAAFSGIYPAVTASISMLGWGPGARCEQVLDRFWARQRALRSGYTRLCGGLLRPRWSTPAIHLRASATAERRHPSIPPQRTACPGPRRPAIIAIAESRNV